MTIFHSLQTPLPTACKLTPFSRCPPVPGLLECVSWLCKFGFICSPSLCPLHSASVRPLLYSTCPQLSHFSLPWDPESLEIQLAPSCLVHRVTPQIFEEWRKGERRKNTIYRQLSTRQLSTCITGTLKERLSKASLQFWNRNKGSRITFMRVVDIDLLTPKKRIFSSVSDILEHRQRHCQESID